MRRSKWEEGKERTGRTFVGSEKGEGEVGSEK